MTLNEYQRLAIEYQRLAMTSCTQSSENLAYMLLNLVGEVGEFSSKVASSSETATTDKAMLRVFTAFSGYDSQCMALQQAGIEFDLVGWSEIDKYAIKAHNALFPQYAERNFGDISKIDWENVPDFDLFTYSFPCTDISNAGTQRGLSEGSGTRSSLLWECRKAIEQKRPKYLLMENVKALASEKFLPFFLKWQSWLSEQGYTNFAQVMNAKDYGVPQNRERLFMVSILGDAWFTFPDKQRLTKRLRDVLEENVDDKYFLSDKLVECFGRRNELAVNKGNGFKFEPTLGRGTLKL